MKISIDKDKLKDCLYITTRLTIGIASKIAIIDGAISIASGKPIRGMKQIAIGVGLITLDNIIDSVE